jgi:hypothetical protein
MKEIIILNMMEMQIKEMNIKRKFVVVKIFENFYLLLISLIQFI